jgi:exodeoxyribonuclease V alpha subunit
MNTTFFNLSKQLVSLADSDLSSIDKTNLTQIIEYLFTDISNGHSCSKLSDLSSSISLSPNDITRLFKKSGIASDFSIKNTALKPLSILKIDNDYLVYISKYLNYEISIKEQIKLLTKSYTNLDDNYQNSIKILDEISYNNKLPNIEQLEAIKTSIHNKLSFITGGPGTGKTTTVTLLLWLFYQVYGCDIKIKLAAPTGKASKRVKESLQSNIEALSKYLDIVAINKLLESESFVTIHKLLGTKNDSIYFRHNQNNKLNLDILIIDESSMVSLPLYSKLLEAIDSHTIRHIIFLGDKNQLSSVEEGYVFASLISPNSHDLFTDHGNISELIQSKRSSNDIGNLTKAVLNNNLDIIKSMLDNSDNIKLYKPKLNTILDNYLNSQSLNDYFISVQSDTTNIFDKFNRQCILCLTNVGILGSYNLNLQIEKHIKQKLATIDTWYSGRPIIILKNDYALGLNNGDIGICVIKDGIIQIIFEDGRAFIPEILPKFDLAYAISIHKSQGSEFNHAYVVIPNTKCSRELLYTAVSRAKNHLTIFSTNNIIKEAIANPTIRNTGLATTII